MIYLLGGAPGAGKTIRGQKVYANLKVGWGSTVPLMELLSVKNVEGINTEWNAVPAVITANAKWFSHVA